MFSLIYEIIVSLLFLVPVLFCLLFILQSVFLFYIGVKEKSTLKKQSALRTFLISITVLALTVCLWYQAILWILRQDDFGIG